MVKLLDKHGLLMGRQSTDRVHGIMLTVSFDLSDAAFVRNVGTKQQISVFANQIRRFGRSPDHISRITSATKYIRRLGNIEDGRVEAMSLLVDAGDEYCPGNGEFNARDPDIQHKGDPELLLVDNLMYDLIREHYTALKRMNVDWDIADLVEKMQDTLENGCSDECGFDDSHDRERLFNEARRLLYLVETHRVATLLATKVTAHYLPPELVEMVRDAICRDEELCVRVEDKSKETK